MIVKVAQSPRLTYFSRNSWSLPPPAVVRRISYATFLSLITKYTRTWFPGAVVAEAPNDADAVTSASTTATRAAGHLIAIHSSSEVRLEMQDVPPEAEVVEVR